MDKIEDIIKKVLSNSRADNNDCEILINLLDECYNKRKNCDVVEKYFKYAYNQKDYKTFFPTIFYHFCVKKSKDKDVKELFVKSIIDYFEVNEDSLGGYIRILRKIYDKVDEKYIKKALDKVVDKFKKDELKCKHMILIYNIIFNDDKKDFQKLVLDSIFKLEPKYLIPLVFFIVRLHNDGYKSLVKKIIYGFIQTGKWFKYSCRYTEWFNESKIMGFLNVVCREDYSEYWSDIKEGLGENYIKDYIGDKECLKNDSDIFDVFNL